MSIRIVIPDSVFGGMYYRCSFGALGFLGTFFTVCDQRWIFLIRLFGRRFGYRTRGDASPDLMTYHDGGFHFPWQKRYVSGRG